MRLTHRFFLGLCLIFGVGCSRDAEKRLVVTGSSTIAPLASVIAKRFEARHPGVRVDVQSGGSSRGVADARRGLADIGMASRALNADESDLYPTVIAQDGICVILHRDNPVSTLSDQQIVDIYTGKLTDWSALGGSPGAIVVVNKAEGRSTLELFLRHFKLRSDQVVASVIIGDNEQGVRTVAGNRMAIGYVSIGTAERDERDGTPIKRLAIGGIAPTSENVRSGKFPLSRPLTLVTKGAPEGLAAEFLAFAQSEAVHDLVAGQHFVSTE